MDQTQLLLLWWLFLTFSVLVANTGANPARGLLNKVRKVSFEGLIETYGADGSIHDKSLQGLF